MHGNVFVAADVKVKITLADRSTNRPSHDGARDRRCGCCFPLLVGGTQCALPAMHAANGCAGPHEAWLLLCHCTAAAVGDNAPCPLAIIITVIIIIIIIVVLVFVVLVVVVFIQRVHWGQERIVIILIT